MSTIDIPICEICGSKAPFLLNKDGYAHHQCPSCGMVFVYPLPDGSFLADEVYSEKSGYQSNKARDLSVTVPTKKQERLLAYLASQPKGKFLDIGCSSGELMYLVQKLGYAVSGIELNQRTVSIAQANGLDVRRATLDKAGFADGSFDYVHMGDLIEHVTDPRGLVADTLRVLKPGGRILVITPNMDCFWSRSTLALYRIFGIPWSVMTPPHHLFNFSDKNLRMLLEQNGFVIETEWYGHAPTLKYELGSLHLLKRWKTEKSLWSLAFMGFSFATYTALFGINWQVEHIPAKRFAMAMVARKP